MKNTLKLSLMSAVSLMTVAIVPVASAQAFSGTVSLPLATLTSLSGVAVLVCAIITWMFYFLIVLAVAFILIAAFGYLTAAGDPEKVKTASNRLIYAAVAVGVGILARAIPLFVGSVLGVGTLGSC